MLLGSSRPYPWFILEENGRYTDDDDDDIILFELINSLNGFIEILFVTKSISFDRVSNFMKIGSKKNQQESRQLIPEG